jgi:hypothetical protein
MSHRRGYAIRDDFDVEEVNRLRLLKLNFTQISRELGLQSTKRFYNRWTDPLKRLTLIELDTVVQ